MPTELELISAEQLGNTLFLVSTIYSFASGNQAELYEKQKLQGTSSSGSSNAAQTSAQLAWFSTWYSVVAYIIFTVVAAIRTSTLAQNARTGTSTASVTPGIVITLNFLISLIGTVNRLPAIEQRIREAQVAVIL